MQNTKMTEWLSAWILTRIKNASESELKLGSSGFCEGNGITDFAREFGIDCNDPASEIVLDYANTYVERIWSNV